MKLLLSDGTQLKLTEYTKLMVQLNGEVTDGLKFDLTDTSAATVRTLFESPSNLESVEIYTDNGVFKDKFNGYQIRHSIQLGDDDASYSVIIAKGTDTASKVDALTRDVNTLSTNVNEAMKVVADLTANLSGLMTGLQGASNTISTLQETVNTQGESIVDLTDACKTNAEVAKTVLDKIDSVKRAISSNNQTVVSIQNEFGNVMQQVTDGVQNMAQVLTQTDAMSADYATRVESLESVQRVAGDAQHAAAGAEATAKDVKAISESLNDSMTIFAAQTTEKVNQASQEVDRIGETIQQQAENLAEAKTAIGEVKTVVDEQVEKLVNAENSLNEVATRVSALEPITDLTQLPLEEAKAAKVEESQVLLARWLNDHPITSTAHKGIMAQYSITREKQSYLRDMIITASEAVASGIEFTPSWNAVGEPCTKDWTIDELRQLALEISLVVRPLVTHQQHIDKTIQACTTVDEVVAVEIDYSGIQPEELHVIAPDASTPETE